jgi:hypothetical protein
MQSNGMEIPEKLHPFHFHGVDIDLRSKRADKQHLGTCPFCDKEEHFFISRVTGQWDCKRCDERGNIPTFLRRLLEVSLTHTEPSSYEELSEERGIPIDILKDWGLAISFIRGHWLIPAYNPEGKLANLYIWEESGVMSTPGCNHQLLGAHKRTKKHTDAWLCEGPWDGMAMQALLQSVKEASSGDFIKTQYKHKSLINTHLPLVYPGAGTFSGKWAPLVKGIKVHICGDNDHPKESKTGKIIQAGYNGSLRTAKHCLETAKSVDMVMWGPKGFAPKLADGYDIRDTWVERGAKGFEYIQAKLRSPDIDTVEALPSEETVKEEVIEPIERTTFEELENDFKSSLHWTPELSHTLLIMLSTVMSTELQGEQVFVRVIGPPGSGKSTLAEAISAAKEYTLPISILTGFHSGFTAGSGKGRKKDMSLIPLLKKKTVIIKDGDTLLSAPNRDQILSELRDIYDGSSRSRYRTGVAHDYEDIRTTFLLCGTDPIRGLNRSSLGERFLDCEILGDSDRKPYLKRSIDNTYDKITSGFGSQEGKEVKPDKMLYLKRVTYGFIKYFKENLLQMACPAFPKESKAKIAALAEFLSYMRARKPQTKEDMEYRPRVELATRISGQLTKLAFFSALMLGRSSIDDTILAILRKVVNDTATGFQFELTQRLWKYHEGLTVQQLRIDLAIAESMVRRLLLSMQEMGIVQRQSKKNTSGIGGRDNHIWTLTKTVHSLAKTIKL